MEKKYHIMPGKEPCVLLPESKRLIIDEQNLPESPFMLSKTHYIDRQLFDEIVEDIKKNPEGLGERIDHRYDTFLIPGSKNKVFEIIICKKITVAGEKVTYVPSMYDESGKSVPFRKLIILE